MKSFKTISPLLWRAIVFLGIFIVVSGALGPRIISGGILFRDGFGVYGSIGKAALFSAVAFVLLMLHRKAVVVLEAWHVSLLGWAAAAVGAFVVAWLSVSQLLAGKHDAWALVGAHGGLVVCLMFGLVTCFGSGNLRQLWRTYRQEILLSVGLGAAFYIFLTLVYTLWPLLARIVLGGVTFLLGIAGPHAMVLPPQTLIFDKFGITVAEYCSGIESIALFTGLYGVVGLLDWPRIRKRRFFVVFPFALLVLCLVNILRIYGLILAGYYINPVLAFSLFHTYAGMVFFIIYSAAFWVLAYKYLVAAKETTPHEHHSPTA